MPQKKKSAGAEEPDMGIVFRQALTSQNWEGASAMLADHRALIDRAVYGESETALHYFAVENQRDTVAWLLERGANTEGMDGARFPLLDSAQLGLTEMCRLLLEAGANPNVQDLLGETPLHKAAAHGYTDLIRILLDSGANPALEDTMGDTAADFPLPRKADEVREIFRARAEKSGEGEDRK